MPFSQDDYIQTSALANEIVILASIIHNYPNLTDRQQRQTLTDILDRIARKHGFELRRIPGETEDEE